MVDFLIYGLKCPINKHYRYIGKSSNGLSRPKSHLVLSHNQSVRLWVEELREQGFCPLIDVLEECNEMDLLEREKHWINYYHNEVYPLMNIIEYKGITIHNLQQEIKAEEEKLLKKLNTIKKEVNSLEELHQFIKRVRKIRGLTQQNLSEISEVGERTIKEIELGKGNPRYKTLKKILSVLGYELTPSLKYNM
jgi:DNA-binding XRE family transcriptional regulator